MSFNPFDEVSPNQELQTKTNLINRVLNNPEGIELLEYLAQSTIMKPSLVYFENPNYGYFREGQNDIVRQLIEIVGDNHQSSNLKLGTWQKLKNIFNSNLNKDETRK